MSEQIVDDWRAIVIAPASLSEALQQAANVTKLLHASWERERERAEALERDLAARPTEWSYQQACKALDHWRTEAKRLADLLGVEPRQM